MSNQIYKHTTIEEAKKKGIKSKATINGMEYTGHIYEGYFFYYIATIGVSKILVAYCDNVREVL